MVNSNISFSLILLLFPMLLFNKKILMILIIIISNNMFKLLNNLFLFLFLHKILQKMDMIYNISN